MRCSRFLRKLTVAGLGVFVVTTGASSQILHPTKENLELAVTNVIRQSTGGATSPALRQVADRVKSARVEREFGKEEGDAIEVMGTVSAAVEDGRGRVIVLDRSFQNLRILDRDATKSFAFGRKGSGPTDFRTPMSLWVSKDGTVSVADAVLGVKSFRLDTPQSARLTSTFKVVGDITGACLSGDEVATYRISRSEVPLVEVRTAEGKVRAAFGDPYKSTSSLSRAIMSEGTIACVGNRSFVTALSGIPFIHGYDSQGRRQWVSRIDRFAIGIQEETVNEAGRSSIGLQSGTRAFSYVISLVPYEDHYVFVQIANHTDRSLRARKEFELLDTYLLDAKTGEGVWIGSVLPKITSARANGFVAVSNEPFPRVLLYHASNSK